MTNEITLPKRKAKSDRRPWHGMAFIMEALVLMIFIILSITVLIQLFSLSQNHSDSADSLSNAVILASNEAERFTVDPSINTTKCYTEEGSELIEVPEPSRNDYVVARTVVPETQRIGTLYRADISVLKDGEIIYQIQSARYVSSAKAGS